MGKVGKDGALKHLIGDCSASIRDSDEIPKEACQALIQHQCNIFSTLHNSIRWDEIHVEGDKVKCPILDRGLLKMDTGFG